MPTKSAAPTKIFRADRVGGWLADDKRYYENAHALLNELEAVVVEVNSRWPKPLTDAVKEGETTQELWSLARKRDLLSDAVKVFAAMSVEAFLNFYGVLRIGQARFDSELERAGPVLKLKKLFKTCENVQLQDNDLLVQLVDKVARRRNRLVHPRVLEVGEEPAQVNRNGDKIPEVAREAVADMVAFFVEFGNRDPHVSHHLPTRPT